MTISASEKRILDALLADGASNAKIARAVQLNVDTVKSHIGSMLRKTGTGTRTELVVLIMRDRVRLVVDHRGGGRRPDGGA